MAELRIGDADREAAVAALGEHFAQGRLTKEEYDERAEVAWSARTGSQLAPLFGDLPGPGPAVSRAAATAQQPTAPPRWAQRPVVPPRAAWRAFPLVPVLIALGVLSALTHLPFVLLGLLVWFVASRHHVGPRPPWAGRGRVHPGAAQGGHWR